MTFSLIKPMMEQETDVALVALITVKIGGVAKYWLANYYTDVVHQRQTYSPMPIETILLPASKDGELPVMQISITDIGGEFAREFRAIAGQRSHITVDLTLVLSGDFDQVFDQWTGFRVLGGIDYDTTSVSLMLSTANLKNQSIIRRRQTPSQFPGLY